MTEEGEGERESRCSRRRKGRVGESRCSGDGCGDDGGGDDGGVGRGEGREGREWLY